MSLRLAHIMRHGFTVSAGNRRQRSNKNTQHGTRRRAFFSHAIAQSHSAVGCGLSVIGVLTALVGTGLYALAEDDTELKILPSSDTSKEPRTGLEMPNHLTVSLPYATDEVRDSVAPLSATVYETPIDKLVAMFKRITGAIPDQPEDIPAPVVLKSTTIDLVATAARTVTVFQFLTYAFTVYSGCKRSPNQSSIDLLEQVRIDTIVPYRVIDCTHFSTSLTGGVADRIKAQRRKEAASKVDAGKSTAQLAAQYSDGLDARAKEFRACFRAKEIPVGTPVDFVFVNNQMHVFLSQKHVGTLNNVEWNRAFIDMFISEDGRAPEMRKSLLHHMDKKQ